MSLLRARMSTVIVNLDDIGYSSWAFNIKFYIGYVDLEFLVC